MIPSERFLCKILCPQCPALTCPLNECPQSSMCLNDEKKKTIFKIQIHSTYTLKNKVASKGSSSDAIEEEFLVPQRTIQSKVL